ncbi:MAG: hypothetical protein NVSMB5_16130 [Candidatus Velthaea sp.]
MRPLAQLPPPPQCWHCGEALPGGASAARYLYQGPSAATAIVEDWMSCRCGAFQNVCQIKEISIESTRPA